MAENDESTSRSRPRRLLTGIGGRTMSLTVKPLSSAASGAVQVSIEFERAALERVLDSHQLEQLVSSALNSERVHEAALRLFESEAAKRLVAGFFDSGLFDEFAARLLESDALWEMIDRIADSPAVTAAISQQGLGFADQVGEEVRVRSRTADDWLERTARRLTRRRERALGLGGEDPNPATP